MIYLIVAIAFLGIFLGFSAFFKTYVNEIGKAESHVGFEIPGAIRGLLKTTLAFSFLSAGAASIYLVYSALLEVQLLL